MNDDDDATAEGPATEPSPAEPLVAPLLTGKQRKYLRGLAHDREATVHVGRAGVTDAVIISTIEALSKAELIKVRMHEPEDKKAAAALLGERTGAAICGLVGHTVILYRPNPDKPRIPLR